MLASSQLARSGAVVRYGIIDSRDNGPSSAFAVPPGDTTAWSSTAWTLGHITQSLIDHRAAAAARGIKAAAVRHQPIATLVSKNTNRGHARSSVTRISGSCPPSACGAENAFAEAAAETFGMVMLSSLPGDETPSAPSSAWRQPPARAVRGRIGARLLGCLAWLRRVSVSFGRPC